MKSRRILEAFTLQGKKTFWFTEILQGLQRNFWSNFHDLCVQKRSRLLWSSDPFCKVSARKIDKKVLSAFSRLVHRANKHSWLQHFVKMLWPHLIILHVHKSFLGYSGTLWSSWLSHFIRMHWIWTHFDCECTRKLWRATCCITQDYTGTTTWLNCSVAFWSKEKQFLHMVDCVCAVFKNMKRRLVVQNLKMTWSKRFIPKLFVWHSSRDIVRMNWRYYRAGLYAEKKRSHCLKQWPIRKGSGDKKRRVVIGWRCNLDLVETLEQSTNGKFKRF